MTNPTHEEMLEEAARREAAFKAVDKLYDENGDALQRLAEIERQELEYQMKIKFNGHSPTDREVEFTHDDQVRLFELMKEEFINHITYARFTNLHYPTGIEKRITKFCDGYGVDVEYDKDRVAFFTALIKEMKYDR